MGNSVKFSHGTREMKNMKVCMLMIRQNPSTPEKCAKKFYKQIRSVLLEFLYTDPDFLYGIKDRRKRSRSI